MSKRHTEIDDGGYQDAEGKEFSDVRVISQKTVTELAGGIAVQKHRTDQANLFGRKDAGIHNRLLDDVERQPANIAKPVTQGQHEDDVAAMKVIQPIDLGCISQAWRVRTRRKEIKNRLQGATLAALPR